MVGYYNFLLFPMRDILNFFLLTGGVFDGGRLDSKTDGVILQHALYLAVHNLLTVLCNTLNGKENGHVESEEYKTVSFSAPNIIASSKRIATNIVTFHIFKRWTCATTLPKGYIFKWKGSIILFDMNECDLSPSLGYNGNQTLIPCDPQNNQSASVKCA